MDRLLPITLLSITVLFGDFAVLQGSGTNSLILKSDSDGWVVTRTLEDLQLDSLIHSLKDNLYSEEFLNLGLVPFGDSLWYPIQTFWVPAGPEEEIVLERVEIKKTQPIRSDMEGVLRNLSLPGVNPSSINLDYSPKITTLGNPKNFRGIKFYPLVIPLITPQEIGGESRWIEEIEVKLKREGRGETLTERLSRLSPVSYRLIEALVGEIIPPLHLSGTVRSYSGYYLIISRQEALPYAIPLLEWKRRMGYRIEVLTYSSGARAEEIKQDIQTRYDQLRDSGEEPFDYILLLGDRTGQPNIGPWTLPSFEGRPSMQEFPNHADFIYGLLEGGENDPFPDVGVGRFGSGSEDRMRMAVSRTLAYERTPYRGNRDWFNRAGVFSQRWGEDWNFSLILTTRWGERILERSGYRELLIQETDGGEDGQGRLVAQALANWFNQAPPALMIGRAQIDYWRNSLLGVEPSSVFPIGINFTGHGEFTMNTLFNSGTPDALKGVVAWTTGWGTPQTLFSNGIWMAMVQGLLVHRLTLGMMRIYAGISLARIFPEMEEVIWTYQTDLDLYGDPGLVPWIGEPKEMAVIHPDTIPRNSSSLGVRIVERQSGNPLIDAQVALYMTGDFPSPDEYPQWTPFYQKVGWTDAHGEIVLPLPSNLPQGMIFVTVTKQGYFPYEGEIVVTQERRRANIIRADIDDRENGNGDSQLNPGEEITIYPYVSIFGEEGLDTLWGRVLRSSSDIIVRDSSLVWSSLNPGEEKRAEDPLSLFVNPTASDGSDHWIDIRLDHPLGELEERIWWDVRAPKAEIVHAVWDTSNGLQIQLLNSGRVRIPRSYMMLERVSFMGDVEPDTLTLRALDPGEMGVPENGGYFRLRFNPMFFPGLPLKFNLLLTSLDGSWRQTIPLTYLSSERVSSTMPLPPDRYGYVALDNSDTIWSGAPSFRWFEITSVGSGGERNGTRLPLNPSLYGAAVAIDLPFPLRFYGEEFNRLTVATNGFVSPGEQVRNVNYQNWDPSLAMGGAAGMIAPYWDNLEIDRGDQVRGVYTYYDTTGGRFVVEWFRMKIRGDNRDQTFQLIIFDPRSFPTSSGDSPLLFQYSTITPVEGNNPGDVPFMSVGISSPDGKTGLTYRHADRSHPTSAPLTNGRAILWTTVPQEPALGEQIIGVVRRERDSLGLFGAEIVLEAFGFGSLIREWTDSMGVFTINNPPRGFYRLVARKMGYNPRSEWVQVSSEDRDTLIFYLQNPLIITDRQRFDERLQPSHIAQRGFTLKNGGNGVLDWQIVFWDGNRDSTIHWLRLFNTPSRGTLAPGDSFPIQFRIQTEGLSSGDYWGRIVLMSPSAQISSTIPVFLNIDPANTAEEANPSLPYQWEIGEPSPNPFNGSTNLPVVLAYPGDINIAIYDNNGRFIDRRIWGNFERGRHYLSLSFPTLTAGVYWGRVKVGPTEKTVKLVLIR